MEACSYQGRFLHFHKKYVKNSKNIDVVWEMISRDHDNSTQGVYMAVKVQDNLLLNIEKRYPVDSYVLSFPGGICEDTDVVSQGLKKLKEETGYIGCRENVTEIGPKVYSDPWKSTEKSQFISLSVENSDKGPQGLEIAEDIQPVLLPLNGLTDRLQEKSVELQAKIDSRLFAYALGVNYGERSRK
ncbi:hypothetical protein SteCoe_16749 [Stentor coeruleus]|uniref:Nudix hydrolase domain-containing protein n=1 Tax=Stentor coeruleus TaxID=5963 RepID=A0A1R2C0I7_9CILI|nr:hypothetical protein SteCoe_16749 [Stentor coeruleus]